MNFAPPARSKIVAMGCAPVDSDVALRRPHAVAMQRLQGSERLLVRSTSRIGAAVRVPTTPYAREEGRGDDVLLGGLDDDLPAGGDGEDVALLNTGVEVLVDLARAASLNTEEGVDTLLDIESIRSRDGSNTLCGDAVATTGRQAAADTTRSAVRGAADGRRAARAATIATPAAAAVGPRSATRATVWTRP